jgi:8-hydroxy-5-deazaflavin:NADPH oxidoreductase
LKKDDTMHPIKALISGFFAAAMLLFATAAFAAHTIAIIGTGDVAAALGPEFAKQGHTIIYGSRDPSRPEVAALVDRTGPDASAATQREAAAHADIIVLAVPGAVAEQVTRDLGDLSGKIILDPTNRVGRTADGTPFHDVPGKGSNAELIQAAAPGARVVKAFNTLNWRHMVDPLSSGGPITIPIVGDDAQSKAAVAELIRAMDGLEVIDLGPLSYAYVLEGMLVVWANALALGTPYNYYLRPQAQDGVGPR